MTCTHVQVTSGQGPLELVMLPIEDTGVLGVPMPPQYVVVHHPRKAEKGAKTVAKEPAKKSAKTAVKRAAKKKAA